MNQKALAFFLSATAFSFIISGCSTNPSSRYKNDSRMESAVKFSAGCAANTRALIPIQRKLGKSKDGIEAMESTSEHFYKLALAGSDQSFAASIYQAEAEKINNMASSDPYAAMEYVIKSSERCFATYDQIKGKRK